MGLFREGGSGPETSGAGKVVRRTAETMAILAALGLASEAKTQPGAEASASSRIEAGQSNILEDERNLISLSEIAGSPIYEGEYRWKSVGSPEDNTGLGMGGAKVYVGRGQGGRIVLCLGDGRMMDCDVSGEDGQPSGAFTRRISIRGGLPMVSGGEEAAERAKSIKFLQLVEAESPEELDTFLRGNQEFGSALVEVGQIDPDEGVELVTTLRSGAVSTSRNPVDVARVQRNRSNIGSRLHDILTSIREALNK
jgi:hypothetical protein